MTSRAVTRLLSGRRIERVELNVCTIERASAGGPLQHVRIHLDDGTVLSFMTQESDSQDYGVSMIVHRRDGAVFTERPGDGKIHKEKS